MGRPRKIVLPGQRFEKLVTIKEAPKIPKHHRWECQCDCGRIVIVNQDNLTTNNSKSCGHCNENTYERYDDNTMQINTFNGYHILVDNDDFEKVKAHYWYVMKKGYPRTYIGNKAVLMHRFLMDTDSEVIDHINGNKLDNRKANLRPATQKENSYNSKIARNNTSGYKGVWWSKEKRKYCAEIRPNGKKKHLGYFSTAEEAARKYDSAASFYFGSFAKLNFAVDIKNQ